MHDIYTIFVTFFFLLVDLLQAAGYFYSISQGSELTVTFVQIAEKEESDDKTKAMSTAMEKIGMLIPDVILLFASTSEILELFLKKVRFWTLSPSPPPPYHPPSFPYHQMQSSFFTCHD